MNLYSYLYTLEELKYTKKNKFCSNESRIDKEVTCLNISQTLLEKQKSNSPNAPVFLANSQLNILVAIKVTQVYPLSLEIKRHLIFWKNCSLSRRNQPH